MYSRQEQEVAISCESCHGAVDSYAPTVNGTGYDGQPAEFAVDTKGNAIKHVYKDAAGNYFLRSRLTGNLHYVPQTLDTIVDNGRLNPLDGVPVYSAAASYAMGKDDGNAATGIGPKQTGLTSSGFTHADNVSCVACHASWSNSCMGCHLEGEYNTGNNFSNVTGERIVFREREADFVYQSPVPFQLGVDTKGKIAPISPNTETFFKYRDRNGQFSQVFSFSDRNGGGANPGRATHPSLSHNVMMPHSIRGRVNAEDEGPRYCVACHLTDDGMATFGTQYVAFRNAMATNDFASLDFNLLRDHIGKNPGNQLNSPLWVHQVAGLGSGLFLFDQNGCPVNPLDGDPLRKGCNDVSPASIFNLANVALNLDRIVSSTGASTGSNNHPMANPGALPNLRDGALNPNLSGPLGGAIIDRLTNPDPSFGIILDSWYDADGQKQGDASTHVP